MRSIIETCQQLQGRLLYPGHKYLHEAQSIRSLLNETVASFLTLKQTIRHYRFQGIGEEIQFYKDIEPDFFERLVYYNKLADIFSGVPVEPTTLITYYQDHIFQLHKYLRRHEFLLRYQDSGKSYLDSILFIHPTLEMSVYPETDECRDAVFFNYTSFVVAKGRAYRQLIGYLRQKINLAKSGLLKTACFDNNTLYENETVAAENNAVRNKISWLETGIVAASADAELYTQKLMHKKNRAALLLSKLQ